MITTPAQTRRLLANLARNGVGVPPGEPLAVPATKRRRAGSNPLPKEDTALERTLETLLSQYRFPVWERDVLIVSERNFQADFCWREARVVVECEGMDHQKPNRYHRDIEKYNLAVLSGWRVLRCTTRLLNHDPHAFLTLLRELLTQVNDETR